MFLPGVNDDVVVAATAMVLAGPLAAVAAAELLGRGAIRAAGACLPLSAVTPMGFAYLGDLAARIGGSVLLVALDGSARGRDGPGRRSTTANGSSVRS